MNEFDRGFKKAILQIFVEVAFEAQNHERMADRMKFQHRESRSFSSKAAAMMEFRMRLEKIFSNILNEEDRIN